MLTSEQIDKAYRDVWSTVTHARRLTAFARAIEAEVRKEDADLIRQMLEAAELGKTLALTGGVFTAPELALLAAAITAARARLGEKEPT